MRNNGMGVAIATLLAAGVVGLTGPTSVASSPVREMKPEQCPSLCPHVYQPVTCLMSNGRVLTFSNRCFAGVYACQRGLKIISCRSADV